MKDATSDSHPLLELMEKHGGITREDGGRTVVREAKTGQNGTVTWVGEAGAVSLADQKVIDASEQDWSYLLGSVSFTMAEQLKNSGGADTKFIDIVAAKFEVLEDTTTNKLHEGLLSNGTANGGLQIKGLAAAVSTTPTSGTYASINRATSGAEWFRNQKFDTASDWADGAVDVSNVKRFLDKGINATTHTAKSMSQIALVGPTHFEALTGALQAIQTISNTTGVGRGGYQSLEYRGIPMVFGGGINYSGFSALTATRTYLLCVKPGGFNLIYHKKAEYEMLEKIQSSDQAAISRLMFTMCACTLGALAKFNWVGFD